MARGFLAGSVLKAALTTQGAWVQSMVRELRYHELCDTAKGKNKNSRKTLNSKSNLKGKGLAD